MSDLIGKLKDKEIICRRLYLRVLTEDDVSEKYVSWLNNAKNTCYLYTKGITRDELVEYVKEKRKSPESLFWGIFCKKNDLHIGNVKLEPIDLINKKATLGILIGDNNVTGKGVCSEVIQCLLKFASESLNVHEINLGVIKDNVGARRCYEKCGFEYINDKEDGSLMTSEEALRMRIIL